jgi:hypothetical protein
MIGDVKTERPAAPLSLPRLKTVKDACLAAAIWSRHCDKLGAARQVNNLEVVETTKSSEPYFAKVHARVLLVCWFQLLELGNLDGAIGKARDDF